MAVSLGSGPDDVTIQVGSNRFVGWQNVSISRSCESMPNNWSLTASAEFLQGAALAGTRPGQSCLIYIGSDLVITGWIDRRSIPIDARNHQVTLSGRGITRNLVDCSADLLNDPGIARRADQRGEHARRGARALQSVRHHGPVGGLRPRRRRSRRFRCRSGETPYQIIECVARYAGFLVYEDEYRQPGAGSGRHHAARLRLYRCRATSRRSTRSSPSTSGSRIYLVVWSGVDQLADLGSLANRRANMQDDTLGEYRLRIIVSEQIAPSPDPRSRRSTTTPSPCNARIGRRRGASAAARRASITCDRWRDSKGTLWTPNWLATIEAPAADITDANVDHRLGDLSQGHERHACRPDPDAAAMRSRPSRTR